MVKPCALSQLPLNKAKLPRLMFTTFTSGRLAATQSRPATMSLAQHDCPLASRTRMATMSASGATPIGVETPLAVTIPVTLVPWPLLSAAEPGPDWRLVPLGQQPPEQKHS